MTQHTTAVRSGDSPCEVLLTSPQQYHAEVARQPRLTSQQEQALIERARSGDPAARDEMILSLLHWVEHVAHRCWRAYGWQSSILEVADLVQVGNLAMVEKLDRALAVDNPYGYLTATAARAILHSCLQLAPDAQVYHLEARLSREQDTTLLDLLPAASSDLTSTGRAWPEDHPLYQALACLSHPQQEVIARHFGLFEHAPASIAAIGHAMYGSACGGVYQHEKRALKTLRQQLAAHYPRFAEGGAA